MFRRYLRETVTGLRGNGRGGILVAVAVGWFLSLGVRLVFPAVLPHLRTDFGMSLSAAGMLLSALWIAYAIGQLPGGVAGDRVGEGWTLVGSTVLAGVTIAAVAVSISLPMLFVASATFGLATALYGPTRYTILSDVYPKHSGAAIGTTLAAGNLGNAILPATAGVIAAVASWRLGFGLMVPLFAVTAVALWVYVPARTSGETSAVDRLSFDAARRVGRGISNRPILLVTLVLLCNSFVWQGFTGFYPTYLIEGKGFSGTWASVLFGLFFATGIVVQPLAGSVSDRIGARRTLLVVVSVIIFSMATLPFITSLLPMIAITILLGSLLGTSPVAHDYLTARLPTDMQGTGLGLLRTVFLLLAASGPTVVGTMADVDWFDEAFLLLAGISVVTLLCAALLPPLEK